MMTAPKQHVGRRLNINRMIPNMMTLLAISAGMTAIRFALEGRWEYAVLAIVVAAILDGLDGRLARLLKGTSKFGAELDSLSDFLCFGVAPAMMLYLWALKGAGRFGWMLALAFTIGMGLRLARFNTMLEDPDTPAWEAHFFVGVPAPAGAGLALLPMILSFQIGDDLVRNPWTVALFLISVAAMLVSTIPTFSFKRVRIPRHWIAPTMVGIGLFFAASLSAPWLTLSCTLGAYLISIPFAVKLHRTWRKRANERPGLGLRPSGDQ